MYWNDLIATEKLLRIMFREAVKILNIFGGFSLVDFSHSPHEVSAIWQESNGT